MYDPQNLLKVANMKMPFGKYQGRPLIELPEPYLIWLTNQDYAQGKLAELLQLTLEIRLNGLEKLILPLKNRD